MLPEPPEKNISYINVIFHSKKRSKKRLLKTWLVLYSTWAFHLNVFLYILECYALAWNAAEATNGNRFLRIDNDNR